MIVLFLAVVTVCVTSGQPNVPALEPGETGNAVALESRRISDMRIGWLWYVGGGGIRTFDVADFRNVTSYHDGRLEYEFSQFTMIPFVSQQETSETGEWRNFYNFRGVINGFLSGISLLTGGVKLDKGEVDSLSPWHFAIFAPDSRVRIRLKGGLTLLLGTRTDYFLYRTTNTDRGIVFTPNVGLEIVNGRLGYWNYGGISASIGFRNFWNFDGPSRSGGLALSVCWWWGAGV